VLQQLCRWLLLSLDRLRSNKLTMTQELIANMLGVRREGITEAAGVLQQAGLIMYQRGHITVLDRPKLEARVCECYAVVKTEYDRLLPAHAQALPGSGGAQPGCLPSRPPICAVPHDCTSLCTPSHRISAGYDR
jgi:hypothetical protein